MVCVWYCVCMYVCNAVGEPLNKEAWKWYYSVVGEERCTIVDTYWQTGKYLFACVQTDTV